MLLCGQDWPEEVILDIDGGYAWVIYRVVSLFPALFLYSWINKRRTICAARQEATKAKAAGNAVVVVSDDECWGESWTDTAHR